MRASQMEIERLIRRDALISCREHPEPASALGRLARQQRLTALIPGIYVHPDDVTDPDVRIKAAVCWAPRAVLTGWAAARMTFWKDAKIDTVTMADSHARSRRGFRVAHRSIPSSLIWTRPTFRVTAPALTTLDLVAETGNAAAIDAALRTGAADLSSLNQAMAALPNRWGNRLRAQLLLDSRDAPWSEAERRTHRILRAAGITDWKTNVRPDGLSFFIDIAFTGYKLAIEIDGFAFHTSPEAFERDRAKQNALILDGWIILRYTWRMLLDEPERVVREIQQALEMNRIGTQSSNSQRA